MEYYWYHVRFNYIDWLTVCHEKEHRVARNFTMKVPVLYSSNQCEMLLWAIF